MAHISSVVNNVSDAIKESLKKLNQEANKFKVKRINNINTRVRLGRSPSLSFFFEKTLAEELSKAYPEKYIFYVDYPISLLDENGELIKTNNQSVYPDIMIVDHESNILKAIIEIKLDLGHIDLEKEEKSDREEYIDKAKTIKLNALVGKYSKEEKKKNKKISLSISPNLKKIAIVVTTGNDHSRSEEYDRILKRHHYFPIFLLSVHFNDGIDICSNIDECIQHNKERIIKAFEEI